MELDNTPHLIPDFYLATFIITYKCPISCPMCFFACGPERNEVMSKEKALKTLEEINDLKISTVCITGGEPFLQIDLMRDLIIKAASYGMTVLLVTNAYWAISKEVALEKLSSLKKLGLEWIQFSLDDQHLRFIPISRIANALEAAIELGFEDIKILGSSKGNTGKFKYQLFYLEKILGICIENVDIIDRPHVSNQYFEDPEQVKFSFQELEITENSASPAHKPGDCLTELMIDVNGDVYPCCNNFIGRIGNIYDNNIKNIIYNLRHNKYFNIIWGSDPCKLAMYLDKTLNTDFCNRRYGSWCELCAQIFQNDRFRNLLTNTHPFYGCGK